jgi:hypothetical protein
MTGSGADHTRKPARWRSRGVIAGVLVLGLPAPVSALDSTVDFQDSQQRTRAGFSTYLRRGAIVLRHAARLSQPWALDANFRVIRETTGTDFSGLQQDSELRTFQPSLTLSYRTDPFNAGVRGTWLRREASGAVALSPVVTRRQYGGWLNAQIARGTRLSSNVSYMHTQDDRVVGPDNVQSGLSGFLRADQSLGRSFQFNYRLTGVSTDVISRTIYRTQWTHDFDLRGTPQLIGNRLTTFLRARSRLFSQRVETGSAGEAAVSRRPLSGGVILDSSPETHDPLEDQGIAVPGLFDEDLEAPTSVNLGDSAPVVFEFGGDYRNIRYDFGNAESFASANLYVDTRLLNPELFAWRVFVTDDPDARIWEELGTDRATVRYREWGTVLQGWEVIFTPDVTARFFKMVNVKFGTTIPDLFVTEMEVYSREVSQVDEVSRSAQWHLAEARLGFQATSALRLGYEGRVETRTFDEANRDLDKWSQAFVSRYSLGPHALNARVDVIRVTGRNLRNTDVETYQLSATRDRRRRLSGTIAWNRTVDQSGGRNLTTDAFTLTPNWRAAPRLRLLQTLSWARHRDDFLGIQSRSFVMINRIEGAPVISLWVNVNWAERWVSENTGVGYDRFTDTSLDVFWTPVPLINLTSRTRYQKRFVAVWDSRQSIAWSPLRGGTVETTLAGDLFYDSRVDAWEQAGRLSLKWKVRPGLFAEGSVELRRFNVAGITTTPLSTFFHVSWNL